MLNQDIFSPNVPLLSSDWSFLLEEIPRYKENFSGTASHHPDGADSLPPPPSWLLNNNAGNQPTYQHLVPYSPKIPNVEPSLQSPFNEILLCYDGQVAENALRTVDLLLREDADKLSNTSRKQHCHCNDNVCTSHCEEKKICYCAQCGALCQPTCSKLGGTQHVRQCNKDRGAPQTCSIYNGISRHKKKKPTSKNNPQRKIYYDYPLLNNSNEKSTSLSQKSSDKSLEKSSDCSSDKSLEKSSDESSEKSTDNSIGKSSGIYSNNNSSEKSTTDARSSENSDGSITITMKHYSKLKNYNTSIKDDKIQQINPGGQDPDLLFSPTHQPINSKNSIVRSQPKDKEGSCSLLLSNNNSHSMGKAVLPHLDELNWSKGTELHSEGRCRPCVFFRNPVKGGCLNGNRCNFCHGEHTPQKKQPRPSKRHRTIQKALRLLTAHGILPENCTCPLQLVTADLVRQKTVHQLLTEALGATEYNLVLQVAARVTRSQRQQKH